MLKGSLVALITPMREDGTVDEKKFAELVEWQIAEGTEGLVPVGTTGESPTLTHEEHKRVVEICVEVARGRVPVVAGTGSNSTAEAIDFTRHAKKAGADACLVVSPYYNKPTQEGLFLHFTAIADTVELPMVVYNIPGRSVVDIAPDTMARLAKHRNIVGVKDATANLARPLHTRRGCGADFIQLSGEDHTALSFLAAGGHGCISVTANVAPRLCAEMHRAWREGRVGEAIAHPGPAGAAARRAVLRNLARPGEVRRLAARQGHRALPPAARAVRRGDAEPGAGGDGGRGAAELRRFRSPGAQRARRASARCIETARTDHG